MNSEPPNYNRIVVEVLDSPMERHELEKAIVNALSGLCLGLRIGDGETSQPYIFKKP